MKASSGIVQYLLSASLLVGTAVAQNEEGTVVANFFMGTTKNGEDCFDLWDSLDKQKPNQ